MCVAALSAHAVERKCTGYPSDRWIAELKHWFKNPPRGYGNVPFYWWNGDSLTHERLQYQLELLSDASTDGFAVSYIHTHPDVDTLANAHGYGSYGRPDAGTPAIFTDQWWETWNWFSGECAKHGIGVGLDDYVVGWNGNGYYVDSIVNAPDVASYQGRLHIQKYRAQQFTEKTEISAKDNVLAVVSYPSRTRHDIAQKNVATELIPQQDSVVYVISTMPSYELHPEFGKRIIERYFDEFESRMNSSGREGMNYFFQDELHHNLNILSWCEDMPEQFKARKGYDIVPLLPALIDNIGSVTPKVRMDYAEVVTQLVEERYLRPVYDWHANRGLIYGSDNNGRGLKPTQYLDYFRVNSWYTAPGNEAPGRGWSYRQTKVSSSIAHVYNRPRVWLEAFHSMGWDSSVGWLTSQLDRHLIAGGNLLCLHGLYYSTHGGWWEWAPPCFHFRMPYWTLMKHWLRYAERMCFLLSQGTHVCDIAVLYPTETLQAYPDTSIKKLWELSETLANTGHDFDYIDYQSLRGASVADGKIGIGNESYRVLIMPDIRAMHHESLNKIFEFSKNGGIVIAYGELPIATTLSGENNKKENKVLRKIFGKQELSLHSDDMDKVISFIDEHIVPDFSTNSGCGTVLHRRVGGNDVYMVMNVSPGDTMVFRQTGKVERWNAMDGSVVTQEILSQSDNQTKVVCDHVNSESSALYVFSAGTPTISEGRMRRNLLAETVMDGYWDFDVIPTRDNRWGDFRLPASNDTIGVEAREFKYRYIDSRNSTLPVKPDMNDAPTSVSGYGMYMLTDTLSNSVNLEDYISREDVSRLQWRPYCYSWQYGVFDNPGSQGFHGLKGKVDDRFIILDKGCHQLFRTNVIADKPGHYRIVAEGVYPSHMTIDNKPVSIADTVYLTEGGHDMLLAYESTRKGEYDLASKKSRSIDTRDRSAVMVYPVASVSPTGRSSYDDIVATRWYNTSFAGYSPYDNGHGMWAFEFEGVPGAKILSFSAKGNILQVWVDGKELDKKDMSCDDNGNYTINMPECGKDVPTITMTASVNDDAPGTAFFSSHVSIKVEGGKMQCGDWSKTGAFRYYSGGIRYRRSVNISAFTGGRQITLDLGEINAASEVFVNGKSCGVMLTPPYVADITPTIKNGDNEIEVEVYNTLSNHYQTIPSAYRGVPRSGLIGPVKMKIYEVCESGVEAGEVEAGGVDGAEPAGETAAGFVADLGGDVHPHGF